MYQLIKQTLLNRTPNRSSYKEWEKFIIYVCDKELNQPYHFAPGKEQWQKEEYQKDIEKFEKRIHNFKQEIKIK